LRKNRLANPCVLKYYYDVMICPLGVKKTGILLLSMAVLVTSVFLSNQAFAGFTGGDLTVSIPPPITCADCDSLLEICEEEGMTPYEQCVVFRDSCRMALMCTAVGGEFTGIETTSVLAAGAQYTAAWMIPVIVAGIGFAIVIARKL